MDLDKVKLEMEKSVTAVATDLAGIRSGKATPSMVENIVVPAYGGTQNLKILELATIASPDPQTITIDPWDKSIIGDIKKGILAANVGINPSVDGEIIRISVPPMTTEDRERNVKLLGTKIENGRISIRKVRANAMQEIKRSEISDDEKRADEKKLQDLTDEYVSSIEDLGREKEKELMTI